PVAASLADASAARILSVEPLAGHNVTAVIETSRYGRKTVVCGAPNCRPGIASVYLPIGKKTIHGVESDGMLASAAELGITRDTAGIVELDGDLTLQPDHIIEIDNKSITHRPDLWGHHGMAREIAAFSGKALRDPVRFDLLPRGDGPVKISIEDFNLCPRYSALVFDNVTVRPSPLWLQYRLESIGLNPINNIVDFTNFVMAELGQPTHAFDRDLLSGDTIFIRPARAGEKLLALNDEEYALGPRNLVIADASGAAALAGVIGGRPTAIHEDTRAIVLESANFQASSIRRTSAQLKLRTDASMRFEKAQDPANTVRALARAVELLEDLSPGIRLIGGVSDLRKPPADPAPILLEHDWLVRKLGRPIEIDEVRRILESLQFVVSRSSPRALEVRVPSWRATRDISIKDDLVEEIGRMIGYESITPVPPLVAAGAPPDNPERGFFRWVRTLMTAQGFTEVYNYSFVNAEDAEPFGLSGEDHIAIANPIAVDQGLMRRSLLTGIRRNILDNSKHFDEFRLFEIGREIHRRPEGLPDEIPHLAAVVYRRDDGAPGLFEAKHTAEALMPDVETVPGAALDYEHPARAAELRWHGEPVGRLFELHPSLAEGRATILYVDLRKMQELRPAAVRYAPPRRYPSSAFDLSVIVPAREHVSALRVKLAGFIPADLRDSIDYVRQYSGPPLPEGSKSVSFRVTVASRERTLSSGEVSAVRTAIIDGMRALGYDLRV
ncbi:MAG: phenylalanine--tRNA ligase subunit beta, partial [Bryobacteraceae bacterium]